ncbi:MAG: hypothetical protein ACFFAO_00860 [Candidatus Hermodarchaeota archaeon]
MGISTTKNSIIPSIKRGVRGFVTCPICNQKFKIQIDDDKLDNFLNKNDESNLSLFSHIHLHGNPIHAIICYIDKDLRVRNVYSIKSIELLRNDSNIKD